MGSSINPLSAKVSISKSTIGEPRQAPSLWILSTYRRCLLLYRRRACRGCDEQVTPPPCSMLASDIRYHHSLRLLAVCGAALTDHSAGTFTQLSASYADYINYTICHFQVRYTSRKVAFSMHAPAVACTSIASSSQSVTCRDAAHPNVRVG